MFEVDIAKVWYLKSYVSYINDIPLKFKIFYSHLPTLVEASWIKDPLSYGFTFNFNTPPAPPSPHAPDFQKTKSFIRTSTHRHTYAHIHTLIQTTNVAAANSPVTLPDWVYCGVLKDRQGKQSNIQQSRFSTRFFYLFSFLICCMYGYW